MMTEQTCSPFSYFPDERLNVLHPHGAVARAPLALTGLEKKLLEMIARYMVGTSSLLHRHLECRGIKCSVHEVRNALDRLSKHQYLTKMELSTPDTRPPMKIYTLGRLGRGCVGKRSGKGKNLDVLNCKKLLSAYQFMIGQNSFVHARSIKMAPSVQELAAPGYYSGCAFRPQAMIHTDDDRTVFLVSVRQEPRFFVELTEKLRCMEQALKPLHREKLNVSVEADAEVVLICESAAHMRSVAQAFREEGLTFDFPIFLASDHQSHLVPLGA